MKKVNPVIILFIFVITILIVFVLLVVNFFKKETDFGISNKLVEILQDEKTENVQLDKENKTVQPKKKDFIEKTKQIDDNYSITFQTITYDSIGDVIFYDKNLTIEEVEALELIANELKNKYPGINLLYVKTAENLFIGNDKVYYFLEISDNYILASSGKVYSVCCRIMNDKNEKEKYRFANYAGDLYEENTEVYFHQKNLIKQDLKITQEQAEDIVIDYFRNNIEDFNKMGNSQNQTCKCSLYQHKSKLIWKMKMGESYVLINAKTGEITDTYFFNGMIID